MLPTSEVESSGLGTWACGLHELALAWVGDPENRTRSYVDLYFAFCLARLGRPEKATELLERARTALTGLGDGAHPFLYQAFAHRVSQALAGQPLTGPLPLEWEAPSEPQLAVFAQLERYVVDRLRKHSSILEPDQRINPYRHWGARISELEKAIAELTDLTDRNEIASRVEKLLREVPKGARGDEQKARVLRAGLEASPRVGEEFARKLLDQTLPAYDALPRAEDMAPLMEQAELLKKALFVAGHFGLAEYVGPALARLEQMLLSTPGTLVFQVLEELAKSALRGLYKLGMHDDADRVLRVMRDLVLKGRDLAAVDFENEESGLPALRALLLVAGQWYYFGRQDRADPIVEVARRALLANDLWPREQTQLACAYAAAAGEAPVELAKARLEEIFRQVKGVKDTYTTSSHFNISQLDVVEAVVLAVVGDNFAQSVEALR
jgi:hypothetical protein